MSTWREIHAKSLSALYTLVKEGQQKLFLFPAEKVSFKKKVSVSIWLTKRLLIGQWNKSD